MAQVQAGEVYEHVQSGTRAEIVDVLQGFNMSVCPQWTDTSLGLHSSRQCQRKGAHVHVIVTKPGKPAYQACDNILDWTIFGWTLAQSAPQRGKWLVSDKPKSSIPVQKPLRLVSMNGRDWVDYDKMHDPDSPELYPHRKGFEA